MTRLPLLLLAALVTLLTARPAAGQERLVVLSEPGTPVIATEVLLDVHPRDADEVVPGLGYLTARAVVAPVRPVLDSLGARLVVQPRRDALSFSLVSAPDAWEESVRTLLVALFRDPIDPEVVERERRALRTELLAREQSPADVLLREVDAAFFGAGHPWEQPAAGRPEEVQHLEPEAVDRFLRSNLTPERAIVAVAGPVVAQEAREFLRPFLSGAERTPPPFPSPSPADSPVRRDYNSITTWVSVSYQVPRGADVEALRMLSALVTEEISFDTRRRSVYDFQGSLSLFPGGGELRFQMVVPPWEADRWGDEMQRAVAALAQEPLYPAVFAQRLRRYRGQRLLELATPEARAEEAARRLFTTGEISEAAPDFDALTPERLHEAARSLESPTLVYLGPSMTEVE